VTNFARCAIYAGYPSSKQNCLSIEQQIRKCRELAARQGLVVLDGYIYADEAVSGATDDRKGLRRLLAAVKETPRPFDVVLPRRSAPSSMNRARCLKERQLADRSLRGVARC
jgi:site-specific DNA recombinase